jgi:hypothetical protein
MGQRTGSAKGAISPAGKPKTVTVIIRFAALFVFALISVSGCSDEPAPWARQLVVQLKCRISPADVQGLGEREVIKLDPPRAWATHQTGGETSQTAVWLVFESDRLRTAQVAWMYKLKRMHEDARTALCTRSPGAPRL